MWSNADVGRHILLVNMACFKSAIGHGKGENQCMIRHVFRLIDVTTCERDFQLTGIIYRQ